MARRLDPDHCCGVIVDVQDFFLSQIDGDRRRQILTNTRDFARLLSLFRIPVVATLEKPVETNGALPQQIGAELTDLSKTFEKAFFDLSRETPISEHIASLNRRQIVIAGCETDVCVLQSCLGLLSQGYEVYLVEDLLFSGTPDVAAALARMKGEGAIFVSYKTLFYELAAEVGNEKLQEMPGPLPKGLIT